MENTIEQTTENTVMLEHVLPHETIGELTKRAHLKGNRFRVSITPEEKVEEEPESVERMAALIKRLESNDISEGTMKILEKGTQEFRDNFAMHHPLTGEKV